MLILCELQFPYLYSESISWPCLLAEITWKRFKIYWCLGATHRHSGLIVLGWALVGRFLKSSTKELERAAKIENHRSDQIRGSQI